MPMAAFPARYRPQTGPPPYLSPGVLTPLTDDESPAFNPNLAQAQNVQDPSPLPPPQDEIPKPQPPNDTQAGASLAKLPPLNPDAGPKASYSGLKLMRASMPPPGIAAAPAPSLASPPSEAPAPLPGTEDSGPADSAIPVKPVSAVRTATDKLQALKQPDAPKSNWAQRLGLAILSMTKLAPAAQQIIHPKWSEEERNYERTRADLQGRQKEEETAAATAANVELKGATAEQKRLLGTDYAVKEAERAQAVKDRIAAQTSERNRKFLADRLKGREEDASYQATTNPMPPGYEFIEDPDKPGFGFAVPPAWRKAPVELLPFLPGTKEGDMVSHKEFRTAADALNKQNLEITKADNKPDKAVAAKQAFQDVMAKVAAESGIPASALTNVGKLSEAIRASKTLQPEERNSAIAYLAANPTPASTGSTADIRVVGMGNTREYGVINKDTGQLEYRNANEINAGGGKYAPAGPGASSMGKSAIFQDLHYNIDTARKAIQGLESMDTGTRAALSYALRHTDPSSALQSFMTGAVGTNLNPQQQEAVQALALLSENAMSLRSVAGMGQGSDDLRAAIQATLPGAKSPTKGYALEQLNKFEQVVKRLEKGVPGMGGTTNREVPQSGTVYVKDPRGVVYHFPNQQAADKFKKDARIQ